MGGQPPQKTRHKKWGMVKGPCDAAKAAGGFNPEDSHCSSGRAKTPVNPPYPPGEISGATTHTRVNDCNFEIETKNILSLKTSGVETHSQKAHSSRVGWSFARHAALTFHRIAYSDDDDYGMTM